MTSSVSWCLITNVEQIIYIADIWFILNMHFLVRKLEGINCLDDHGTS